MKLLTKNTDYAIRALLVLGSRPDEYISARDIAKIQEMPYQYLRKILRELISAGFVESREGGRGGFKVKRAPAGIKVVDLMRVFQGEVQFLECMFRKSICNQRVACVLRKNIKRIEKAVAAEFERITIGSLLKEMNG